MNLKERLQKIGPVFSWQPLSNKIPELEERVRIIKDQIAWLEPQVKGTSDNAKPDQQPESSKRVFHFGQLENSSQIQKILEIIYGFQIINHHVQNVVQKT